MCGLTGFWVRDGIGAGNAENWLKRMAKTLEHRGPDDTGLWFDEDAGVGLAHRRLAILDLSPAGHQPMHSSSGRYVIVFNGEIYNYAVLRAELASIRQITRWRGHSDTEVLLTAIEEWGLEKALRRCVGMFAFALWDKYQCALILARDRFGEKPLYYGWQWMAGRLFFLFGSELKALSAHPAFHPEIDQSALADFMRFSYVPTPRSIYRGIFKLPPGTWFNVEPEGVPIPYWSLPEVIKLRQQAPFVGTLSEAVDAAEHVLGMAIAGQRIADVPLGAFLSGGVDSSAVVALMQSQSMQPVRTFTIGFTEARYDESEHARLVARHLGTEHTEWRVTPNEAREVIPRLPRIYDEPFADSSQIPTIIVSQLARSHVTVALSGDGGDEVFGGYNRYKWARFFRQLPRPLRILASGVLESFSPMQWDKLYEKLDTVLPQLLKIRMAGDKASKIALILKECGSAGFYRRLVSTWDDPGALVIGAIDGNDHLFANHWATLADLDSDEHRMMALDTVTYLSDDILCKVDRAAMGVSLETRVPMLDHRLVEFAWSLPLSYKIRAGQGKWLMRRVLDRYVPSTLINRPKMGFGFPLDDWLRGPLRDWAEDLLDESRMHQAGFLRPEIVQQIWTEHLSGRRNWQDKLWAVLMFQGWFLYGR